MDAYSDDAPNQITAPLKNGASLLAANRSESSQQLLMPSSAETSPTKVAAVQEEPQDGTNRSAVNAQANLSTIVSNVSSDDVVDGTAFNAKQSHAQGAGTLIGDPVVEEVKITKRKLVLFACCFAAPDTVDAEEKLRISMLNDTTHHAASLNGAKL